LYIELIWQYDLWNVRYFWECKKFLFLCLCISLCLHPFLSHTHTHTHTHTDIPVQISAFLWFRSFMKYHMLPQNIWAGLITHILTREGRQHSLFYQLWYTSILNKSIRTSIHALLVTQCVSLFHWTLLTKHKFTDKINKNFRMDIAEH
jgi:hypothetical protein